MRLIALCPVRQDAWSLSASSRAVLKWCDGLIVCQNAAYFDQAAEDAIPGDPRVIRLVSDAPSWDEADIRLSMLEAGRAQGGTHFALVDADEILTANLIPAIRGMAGALELGAGLRLPWLHLWRGLDQFRDDESPFGRQAHTSVVFRDHPSLTYRPADDGYQFHMRAPAGVRFTELKSRDAGLMHMQHVSWRRVVAKQAFYRMVEHLRWGATRTVKETNRRYKPATDETGLVLKDVPAEWWRDYDGIRERIDMNAEPWQAGEIAKLFALHGRERFAGLELGGL